MHRAILPVTLGLGGLALTIGGAWAIFATQREDVGIARSFLTHIAAQDHEQARALMTPALQNRLRGMGLERTFGEIEPWDHIGFSSRTTNGLSEHRQTQLYGSGEAQSGCESGLDILLINGLVEAFTVSPLCHLAGTDT